MAPASLSPLPAFCREAVRISLLFCILNKSVEFDRVFVSIGTLRARVHVNCKRLNGPNRVLNIVRVKPASEDNREMERSYNLATDAPVVRFPGAADLLLGFGNCIK